MKLERTVRKISKKNSTNFRETFDFQIFLIKNFRNEHLFQAEGPILPKIHEWWKEENFYSTSDGREIINNFGCITRFLINVAKKFTVKNFTGDTQRNPLKIYLNALKIHLTAIRIMLHILLDRILFRIIGLYVKNLNALIAKHGVV